VQKVCINLGMWYLLEKLSIYRPSMPSSSSTTAAAAAATAAAITGIVDRLTIVY
jgi:hypothetical protein